jgi:hypothetical protein
MILTNTNIFIYLIALLGNNDRKSMPFFHIVLCRHNFELSLHRLLQRTKIIIHKMSEDVFNKFYDKILCNFQHHDTSHTIAKILYFATFVVSIGHTTSLVFSSIIDLRPM